jgi:8-oxo-dGTP diphosphatase
MNQSGLYNHVKQLVAVDCIIFGYEASELKLLLFKRELEPAIGQWSLVGGWVNDDESVETAARRVLKYITGLHDIFLEQVQVFSKPDRDPGGRVLSIAFFAFIRLDCFDKDLITSHGAKWVPLYQRPSLIFDHDQMVEKALERLRLKASYELIGKELLPEKFTLLQLRNLYNAIYQTQFDPGNFRKKILVINTLKRLNDKNTTASKKGAYYYQFKENSEKTANQIIKIPN